MDYTNFLKNELVLAFGCTEPIALAYGAAVAKKHLGQNPSKITANLSGNIIKNANSVVVPGTYGRKGMSIAIACGALLGDADKKLEVLTGIDKKSLPMCDDMIEKGLIKINHIKDVENLYIDILLEKGDESSRVIISGAHTNIIKIEKNAKVLFKKDPIKEKDTTSKNVDFSFDKIYDFSINAPLRNLIPILDTEIKSNYELAKEGLKNDWGAKIGKTILNTSNGNEIDEMIAYAVAGSDARMSGCELPAVINSGSGNQGITVSVPIIHYCKKHDIPKEKQYRALIFANLLGLYIKEIIGKLSAYCGVVSAAAASICGIAYLQDVKKDVIKQTMSNSLVVNSGIICDGAKPSCAGKIASSLRNAFLGYEQAKANDSYNMGDGIVKSNVDETIKSIGVIARSGMKKTDEVILSQMLKKN